MGRGAIRAINSCWSTGNSSSWELYWRKLVQNQWGKPEVVYSGRGQQVRQRLGVGEGHVTLTDEAGLVVAVAVLLRAA